MPRSRIFFFKENQFYHFCTKLPPLGIGVMKFIFFCFLILQMLHTELGKVWLNSSWGEDFNARAQRMTDEGQQTSTHGKRSPESVKCPKQGNTFIHYHLRCLFTNNVQFSRLLCIRTKYFSALLFTFNWKVSVHHKMQVYTRKPIQPTLHMWVSLHHRL